MREAAQAWIVAGALALGVIAAPAVADAQYFGRNKVQYTTFDFKILKTEHFDVYYYPQEAIAAQLASRMAERWYSRLSRFFDHQLRGRQALILYAAPAHFRQTNAVEGLIGDGTGGVTEALKRRIVLPMSGSLADTNHVIGHELVHAFQFDMTGADPRESMTSAPGILAYPLWFVEGMAEYLSLGPVDAQTAMWMRDAALHEKLPQIKDLDNPKYFPYRWGHAFWAFIGAKYGDRTVASLVRSAANPRFDLAGMARQLGSDPDTLTADWHRTIRLAASAVAAEQPSLESDARRLIGKDNGGGRYNIGPRLSPDGRHVAFFSERDRFAIELFLADTANGHIERKLLHSATDPHFDSLEFLDSAGAWSPDGRTLAVVAVRSAHPVLAVIDPTNANIIKEIALPGLDDALNPSYSPDGRVIVLSGNQGGLTDLYLLTLATGTLDRLTNDIYGDFEASFTPDSRSLVFVTERFSTDLATLQPGPLRLARLDLATREITPISGFLLGKHLSPQVSADGRMVTFIAEPDGISNLYRMPIDGGPIVRLTSFPTGVAGITASSPALSSSTSAGRFAFSVFEDDGHVIYLLDEANLVSLVPPAATGLAAVLPGRDSASGDVARLLADPTRGLPPADAIAASVPYPQRLTLDAIGQPTVSAGVGQFGGYIGGSISAFFSDMLGNRMLGIGAQVAGSLADLGGQLLYVNRKHRWNWATSVEQTPYRIGYLTLEEGPETTQTTLSEVIERQTSRGVYGLTAYPFNAATRVEFSAGARQLTFTRDTKTDIFDSASGALLQQQSARTTLAQPLYLAESSVALVHDTSFFGATSPILGRRYRVELDQSVGSLDYQGLLVDWRQYFMPKRPVTIAVRALHYGRYGPDAEDDRLVNLYAGYPELVHGYGLGSFSASECQQVAVGQCPVFDNLIGSRLLVANIEVRAPLIGLFRGDIQYGRLPVEVAAFMDAGVAWSKDTRPAFVGGTREVVRSYGGAIRFNIFGLAIVELAGSHPLDRLDTHWRWQLGLRQGF